MSVANPFTTRVAAWEVINFYAPSLGRGGRLQVRLETLDVTGGGLKESERDVPGKDGVTRTFLGYRDAEVSLGLLAQDADEFKLLEAFFRLYRTKRSGAVQVIEVSHPQLAVHGISQVYVFDLDSGDFDPEVGWLVKVKLREWQPSEKKQTKGASKTEGGKGTGGSGAGNGSGGQPKPTAANAGKPTTPSKTPQSAFVNGFKAGSTTAAGLIPR